jgi:hypothetical protein
MIAWDTWWMSEDFLPNGMKQLDKRGVDMATVKIVPSMEMKNRYLVVYKIPEKELE